MRGTGAELFTSDQMQASRRVVPGLIPFAVAMLVALAGCAGADRHRPTEPPAPADGGLADGFYILNGDYLGSYFENGWRILTGPSRFEARDWRNLGLVAGAAGALVLLDEEIDDFWRDSVRGDTSAALADAFEPFGDSGILVVGSIGGYAVAEMLGRKREKAAFLLALESVVLSGAVIAGVRQLTNRERPRDADDRFDWHGPFADDGGTSFPSGHAGGAFAAATVFAEVYGDDHRWVPWLAYPIATATALGRLDRPDHWASDIFVGATIGHLVGKLVVRYNPFLERHGIALRAYGDRQTTGIALAFRL